MKKYLLLLFIGLTIGSFAQTDLYVSKQTGEHTTYQGEHSKSTDRYETGTTQLTVAGPLKYTLDPPELSIGTNETKNWHGTVYPDVATAPEPGTSVNAIIFGDYIVTFSRPVGTGSGGTVTSTYQCDNCYYHTSAGAHEIVRKTGTTSLDFKVHSVNVDVPNEKTTCPDKESVVNASGYPSGGTYSWVAGANTVIISGANDSSVYFKSTAFGTGSLTVTYRINGVSYTRSVVLNCMTPKVTLNVPDTVDAAFDQQITITPTMTPTGSAQWSVSDGLTLMSGPYNYVAFVKVKPQSAPQFRTVTLKATVCGQVIVKTVVIKVNPCNVTAPDIVLLVNVDGTITATGNMQGTYAWTAGPDIQIQGPANQATVTVKGNVAGIKWAEVTFTGTNNCKTQKRVKIEVLAKPRLTVNVAYASMATMCKGERRILSAIGEPAGGTYAWNLSHDALIWYGQPANNQSTAVVEAAHGGPCAVTCTYTFANQTATVTNNATVKEYSKVVVAGGDGNEVAAGTTVTYTATAYDENGMQVAAPALHWRVVYIPIGQENNVGNWVSYELQGTGNTQTYTWGFPQGSNALPGNPPHKMTAWIEASEYCTYRSGSVHLKVVK